MALNPLEKLCKWRSVLAGWHTGSRALLDPSGKPTEGVQAMRDLMDKWLIMRCEVTAVSTLMIEKGVYTAEEYSATVNREAALLDKDMERFFPGMRTSDEGVVIYDIDMARETMRVRGFPP